MPNTGSYKPGKMQIHGKNPNLGAAMYPQEMVATTTSGERMAKVADVRLELFEDGTVVIGLKNSHDMDYNRTYTGKTPWYIHAPTVESGDMSIVVFKGLNAGELSDLITQAEVTHKLKE